MGPIRTRSTACRTSRRPSSIWTLQNCRFIANTCNTGPGGAVYAFDPLTVVGCAFLGNHADAGGGVYTQNTANLSNCAFAGNSVVHGGAGLYVQSGTTRVSDCTFTANVAAASLPFCHRLSTGRRLSVS